MRSKKNVILIDDIPLPVDKKSSRTNRHQKSRHKAEMKQRRRQNSTTRQRLSPDQVTTRQKNTFGMMVANAQEKRGMGLA